MIEITREANRTLRNLSESLFPYKYFEEDIIAYVKRIKSAISKLETLFYREKPRYNIHKQYGKYVYTVKMNRNTMWYIIYDIAANGDIIVNHIINNYNTIKGIGTTETKNNNTKLAVIFGTILLILLATSCNPADE